MTQSTSKANLPPMTKLLRFQEFRESAIERLPKVGPRGTTIGELWTVLAGGPIEFKEIFWVPRCKIESRRDCNATKECCRQFHCHSCLAGLGYSAWRFVSERSGQSCQACARPVYAHMKTVAILDGKRATYCCPACALSAHQQSGKPVQVVELTDYPTITP
jgi:hypothetical protein